MAFSNGGRHRDYAYAAGHHDNLHEMGDNGGSVLVEDSQPEGNAYRSRQRQRQSPESQPFDFSYEQHYSRAAAAARVSAGGAAAPRFSQQQQQQQESMGESQISDDLYYHGGGAGDDSFQATQQAYTQPAVSQQTAPAGSGGPEPSRESARIICSLHRKAELLRMLEPSERYHRG